MIEAHRVGVRIGAQALLDGVSLDVIAGEILCVVGPNGAGKSTLLAVLSGAQLPHTGSVKFAGRDVLAWPHGALARRRAVLPQASSLSFPLSVTEVALLGRLPCAGRGSRSDDLEYVEAALVETSTAHLAERRYTTLSGGERQRVQLARVLTQIGFTRQNTTLEGRCLLLDEPTTALDLAHQHACLRTARRVADRGAAVLAIVHDPNLALLYGDRVAMLAGGRLVAAGAPEDVITASRLRDVFGVEVAIQHHPVRDRVYAVPL